MLRILVFTLGLIVNYHQLVDSVKTERAEHHPHH